MSEKNENPRPDEELNSKIIILKNEIDKLINDLNILRRDKKNQLDKINNLRNEIWEKQKTYVWIKQIQQLQELN